MKFISALVLSFLILSSAAYADTLSDGIAAFNAKDYDKALKLLQPLADQGNAEAQFQIGYMYLYGQGVNLDYAKAYFWLTLAAEASGVDPKTAETAKAGRTQIAKHLTAQQLDAVKQQIDDWKPAPAPEASAPPATP